ncbi:MAG: DNA phosphorothioation-associated putative methyltransferase, partial [Thiohalocapsa sp.]
MELLLPADDRRRETWAALTAACESIGLFDDPRRIGYKRQWEQLVRERGYRIVDHALVPIGNDEGADDDPDAGGADAPEFTAWEAARHLTALTRYGFSAPVQSLARHGFLGGSHSLFDYGCGRGDDVRGLLENGLDAAGWDPFYAPEPPVQAADLVNLGFVINVIEDFDERLEALTRAWSLARTLLVVSVMLANQNDPRGQCFRDGVMTKRGTFQKYFSQGEIKAFVEQVLDEEPIAVAPGVLYVFRDKDAEQRFLVDRYRSRRTRLREPSARVRERPKRERRNKAEEQYLAHRDALERLWAQWLDLGRKPDRSESADALVLSEAFGSVAKALRFIEARKAAESDAESVTGTLEAAEQARLADLTLYFALDQFERRKPYQHLEPTLRRDIKHFFGDYGAAR